jgi:hypothetical protein
MEATCAAGSAALQRAAAARAGDAPFGDRKLPHLVPLEARAIVHRQHRLHPAPAERHRLPVRHWVEVLDEALAA